MRDQRKLTRMHVLSYLKITENHTDKSVGRVLDITTKGMRICGDQPIAPNTTYRFKMILPNIPESNGEICFEANVIWCIKDDIFDLYDAGIQLLDVPPQDLELLEYFIEHSTFEERWLAGMET